MSIHKRGNHWAVRWRADGRQHARSFAARKDATRFDAELRQTSQRERDAAQRREIDQLLDERFIASLGDDPAVLIALAERLQQRASELRADSKAVR